VEKSFPRARFKKLYISTAGRLPLLAEAAQRTGYRSFWRRARGGTFLQKGSPRKFSVSVAFLEAEGRELVQDEAKENYIDAARKEQHGSS